ncbi:MAG: M20 family metallopeptidase [Azoarcus sp.]|jgi:succinyl-diaminopimelate desuccinylase|nr:M20 family metallopeptidase [Azoarcus sp.]
MNPQVDPVELTRALVRMNTVNRDGQGDETPCIEHLAALLRPAGFACRIVEFAPRRASLVARLGGDPARPALAFTGHVDVVPLGAAPWRHDPFGAEIVDGKLYGRGSSDMKSGVAAFVAAVLAEADAIAAGAGVVLIVTAGEESGCEGAIDVARRPELNEMLANVGALVVAEPTGNRPLAAHKGALWLRARASGTTAHGSMPERGDNAIYKLAPALLALRDFDFGVAEHALMGRPTLNVGLIQGGLNINSVPDAAHFTLDIRTVAGQDHAALRQRLQTLLGPQIALEDVLDTASVFTDPQHPWMRFVTELCTPGEAPGSVAYFTDAAILRARLDDAPTVILGPGEAHMAHQTDEYCLVERIVAATGFYRRILADWRTRA